MSFQGWSPATGVLPPERIHKINVTIKNWTLNLEGNLFYEYDYGLDQDLNNYADFGILLENHENVTIENLAFASLVPIGNSQKRLITAPFLNELDATLTLKGNITIGQSLQYANSFLYNQGTTNIEDAILYFYDAAYPSTAGFDAEFSDANRAEGGITNAINGNLNINRSSVYQEAFTRSSEYTSLGTNSTSGKNVNQATLNTGLRLDDTGVIKATDGLTSPAPLEYLIKNCGNTTITESMLAGILAQDGDANISKSFIGLPKSSIFGSKNIVLGAGSTTEIIESTADNIEGSGSLISSNSVIVRGEGSGSISEKLLSSLSRPSNPSLFSDALQNNTTYNGEFIYQTYDPSKLDPQLKAAIDAVLSGTTPGGGGSSGGGTGGGSGSSTGSAGSSSGASGAGATGGSAGGNSGDSGPSGSGSSTGGTGQLVATHRVDILTGTSESDRFVFPDVKSGTNRNRKHKKHQADQIINFNSEDTIEFDGFDVRVIGLGPSNKQIFDSYGTVRNTRTRTVHKLFGKAFKPREAALFQVHGISGSFLAVNNKRSGFDRHDTLIHLVDFVPSTEAPLILA